MTKIGYWDTAAGKQRERDMTLEEEAEFAARQNAPVPPAPRRITKLAFRNRFTQAEKVAIELAAIHNPKADITVHQQAAALRANLADLAAATYIDLDRPDTRAAVQGLELAELIAAGRAGQILDADIQDVERYLG
jgi:hypothetical protein